MSKNFLRLAILTLAVLVSLPAVAQWSEPRNPITGVLFDSTTCPANVPGCHTPINVSQFAQTKAGSLTIQGSLAAGTTTITKPYTISGTAGFGVYKTDVNLLLTTDVARTADKGGSVGFSNANGFLLGAIKGGATNSLTAESGGYLAFYTTSAKAIGPYEKMRITEAGNIGVGTAIPDIDNKLQVAGRIAASGPKADVCTDIDGDGTIDTGVDKCLGSIESGGTGLPAGVSGQTLRHNGTAWVADSNLFNNGTNVGIGTAAPGAKLDVAGKARVAQLQVGTAATAGYVLTADSSGNATWKAVPSGGGTTITGEAGRLTMYKAGGGLEASPLENWYDNRLRTDGELTVQGLLRVGRNSGLTRNNNGEYDGDDLVLNGGSTSGSSGQWALDVTGGDLRFYNPAAGGATALEIKPSGQLELKYGNPANGKILAAIDNDGRAVWKTPAELGIGGGGTSGKVWYTGEHCGLYVSGVTASGKKAANGKVNCVAGGNSYDPSVSCPSGFTQLGGDFANSNDEINPDRFMYTCVKN